MSEFITRAELLEALDKIADRARLYSHGEYDSVRRVLYDAKAEVCEELKTLLMLPEPSLAEQVRARKWREQFHNPATHDCACGAYDVPGNPRCPVHDGDGGHR